MSSQLKLLTLGRPQIIQNEAPIYIFHKAQALFYYLAVTGRPHQRSALLNLLWSHIPENNRKNNLRVTLSYLRKNFKSYLSINRHTVSINTNAEIWVDVEAIKTALQSVPKTTERLQEIIKLYQGPFLEGFQVPEEKEFETWIMTTRKKLEDTIVQVLHTLALRYQELTQYAEAIDSLNRLLSLQPWREESHQLVITLLAQSGQRSVALDQFEICCHILEEHKRTPSPDLLKLHQTILESNGAALRVPTLLNQGNLNSPLLESNPTPQQITVMYCHWHDDQPDANLEPSVWQSLQTYCQHHLMNVIKEQHGQIAYHYNGELLVAFSSESVADSAYRAIQTGLTLLQTFVENKPIHTHTLSISIHTGLVLLQKVELEHRSYTEIVGHPLEVVQSLARQAPPQTLTVSSVVFQAMQNWALAPKDWVYYPLADSGDLEKSVYQVREVRGQ